MKLFNNEYNDKKDIIDKVPKEGFKRYLFIFSNHFFRLVGLNLVFIITCLPIITIPASIFGLTNVIMNLYNTGNCSPTEDYLQEFRKHFFSRILAVFILLLFPISISSWFFIIGYPSFGIGIGITLMIVFYLTLSYFILVELLYDETITKNITRSFFLVLYNWKKSLIILIIPILFYLLNIYYLPLTATALIFIVFSAGQLFLCNILEKVV